MHLLDRLTPVYRHRRLVAAVFVLVVALFMLKSYSTTPQYMARARLLMDEGRANVGGFSGNNPGFWVDPPRYYRTQMFIIGGRGLAQMTLRRLDLDAVPEFSGDDPGPVGPLAAISSTLRGATAAVLELIRPPEEEPPADLDEPPLLAADENERAQITNFRRLNVVRVGETQMVDVTFIAADPVFAANAVNTHVDGFIEFNFERHHANTQKTLAWLDEELAKQQGLVEDSQRALAEYRVSEGALSLQSDTNLIGDRLRELNARVTRAEQARLRQESRYAQVGDLDPMSDAAATFPSVAQEPGVREATERLGELESERVELSGRYGARHPTMVKLNASIESARQAVRTAAARAIETIRRDYETALQDEQALKLELQRQEAAGLALGRKNIGYSVLEREAQANQRVYENLLQQQKELQVVANSRSNTVQIVDLAQVPGAPFTPNTRRDWFTALVAGLFLSLGLVLVVEYMDDTIKTPEDVARRLGIPLLGLVPALRGEHRLTPSEAVPHDFSEAFRSLRTSMVFTTGGDASTKIIGVTSTQPLEGKTTSASNLAMVLALGGTRVLLIDADMRRPSLHKALAVSNTVGLSHVLVGQAKVRASLQRTHDPNLFILPAGQPPPNPSELLASDKMQGFIETLKSSPFDWIIIDTPPVLAVTDAVIVARLVSGMLFVVGSELTRATHAERALEMLQSGPDIRIVGAVLNRVDLARNKYYYSRYYGSHYQSYQRETTAA